MITHVELVKIATKWAYGRHDVVFAERSDGSGELPDVMAFSYRWSTLIECKISMSDFHADKRKPSRRDDWRAKDCIGNLRIYCCPKGIIPEIKIPEDWMLLEVYPSGFVKLNVNPFKGSPGMKKTIWWHELTSEALMSERFMLFRALQDINQQRISEKIVIKV